MVNVLYFIFHSTKPELIEILKFMCQIAAMLSDLLTLCDSIDL